MKTVSIALFAGVIASAFVQPAQAARYREKLLYSFCGQQNCTDGANPRAGVVNLHGTLYGTTPGGGAYGYGAVFAVNRKTGAATVVHSFDGGAGDGALPYAGLINLKGTLYSTTAKGGNVSCSGQGCGTVFSIDPNTGTETVIHNFGGTGDGDSPEANLIDVNGTLYGTTFSGGSNARGTVFSLDPGTGAETVLYSFSRGPDASKPVAGLIAVNSRLYGTTPVGGRYGAGTVFSFDLKTGAEKVRYSFCSQSGCPDGADPEAGLTEVNGILYGTTASGGTGCASNTNPGCGTVFAFDPKARTETVLHTFLGGADGQWPLGGLIAVTGTLYGTTSAGGGTGCFGFGCGTVFSFDPNTGTETVLYSFGSGTGTDGAGPIDSLIAVRDTFYGTTDYGGASGNGGAVFALRKKH